MANESRIFHIENEADLNKIVNRIIKYLNVEKQMEVQSSQTAEGFILQASQSKDAWRTISGTRLAITVQFILSGNMLTVKIGEGNWSDKLGAGALGLFIAWPFAVTAGYGALKQKLLPGEIFAVVEKTVYQAGKQTFSGNTSLCQTLCPNCLSSNPNGSKFCNSCGSPIAVSNTCSACGAELVPCSKFCNQCGAPQ